MSLIPEIVSEQENLMTLRRDIHAHPELAFDESRTSALVAKYLQNCGIAVTEGVGGTGVVGTLHGALESPDSASRAIGLRADMDALPMMEENGFAHVSKHEGVMHACGHDGHTAMLLGAAKYLAATRNFSGRVEFIFQPAEEANSQGSGARAMIEDGLFERFPVDNIYGIHNMPGLAAGHIGTRPGPLMAAMYIFEVTVSGQGTHGALPHKGVDVALVCAQLVVVWQSIVSRNVDPLESAVLSATSIQVGDTYSVMCEQGTIRGSVRCFSDETALLIKEQFYRLTQQLCESFGASVSIDYKLLSPATVSAAECADVAYQTACGFLSAEQVSNNTFPIMASEDFAYMLNKVPGAYIWLGNGEHSSAESPCLLHDPRYDFNDELLAVGATFWVKLVEGMNS